MLGEHYYYDSTVSSRCCRRLSWRAAALHGAHLTHLPRAQPTLYALWRSFTQCAFIESEGDVVFFKNQRGEALRECVDQKIAATADEKAVPAVAEEKEEEVLKIAGF